MRWGVRIALIAIVIMLVPCLAEAQGGFAGRIRSLHEVLEQLYDDMMPLCSRLIGVGRGIAGFAATWYIATRVWGHIARAEPVDFYPLFRPFVLGFAVLIFPSVIAMINGVMRPTVLATAAMVVDSDKAVSQLLQMKEEAIKKTAYWQMYVGSSGSGDRDKWYKYNYGEQSEGIFQSVGNDIKFAFAKASYNFRNAIKQWMSEILKVLFEASALCINTIRTFYLIVLAILGPLVFGIAVFDGFQHTLTVWIARYLNIFLWLPVANIFGSIIGKIQENMLKEDLQQIATNGDTFFSTTDTAYLIFMIIGIIGYFTVPAVANYIIHAGGGNALLHKVTNMMSTSSRTVVAGATSMTRDVIGDGYNRVASSMADYGNSGGYFKDKIAGKKMFKTTKNIDTAFRHVRLFSIAFITGCILISVFIASKSYELVTHTQQKIYILANGKALEAYSADRKDNIPVEARDHVKMFHHYFFSLDPDDKVIQSNIIKALYLADATAKQQYDNLKENGYYSNLIAGNISQEMQMDSIEINTNIYPFYFRYKGQQKIIRPTTIVIRSLVTEGYLRNVSRSDNNSHGFLIEKWRTIENKDINIQNR